MRCYVARVTDKPGDQGPEETEPEGQTAEDSEAEGPAFEEEPDRLAASEAEPDSAEKPAARRSGRNPVGFDPFRVQRDIDRMMKPLLEPPVLRQIERQQETMRKAVEQLTRTPMLDMLERQRKQREMIVKSLTRTNIVLDAFDQQYGAKLIDDARRVARGVLTEFDTRSSIQDWLDRQRVIIAEAAKAEEEGRDFDLEAYGGPKLNHTALQTYLALLAVVLSLFQILTDDGLTAAEQRAITEKQTRELREAAEDQKEDIAEAIDRQTDALKEAVKSVDRPEIHITVKKGGKLVIKEGQSTDADEPPRVDRKEAGRDGHDAQSR